MVAQASLPVTRKLRWNARGSNK